MLNYFSDAAIKVVQLAHQEASKLKHEVIGTEHLLLGLLSHESCKPSQVLKALGITRTKAKQEVLRIMAAGTQENESRDFNFTVRAKAVFRMAQENRMSNEDLLVGPDDLMYAMLSVPRCTAQKVLHALDIEPDDLITRLSTFGTQFTESNMGVVTIDQLAELHERIRSGELPVSDERPPDKRRIQPVVIR